MCSLFTFLCLPFDALAWFVCSLLLFLLMQSLRLDETQSQSHPDSLFLFDFSEQSNDTEMDEEVDFREKSWTLDQLLDRIDTSLDFIADPDNDLQVTRRGVSSTRLRLRVFHDIVRNLCYQ